MRKILALTTGGFLRAMPCLSWSLLPSLLANWLQDPGLFLANTVLGSIETDRKGKFLGKCLINIIVAGIEKVLRNLTKQRNWRSPGRKQKGWQTQ
jgi:hypothetical protein